MLPDTQAISDIEAGETSLTKIREGGYSSEYLHKSANTATKLSVAHSVEKSTKFERHLVKLSRTTLEGLGVHEAYIVIRSDPVMGTVEPAKVAQGLVALLTDAYIARILAWES